MLDDFRALAIFVAVADEGGFSQAGRALRVSTSVVSHHISKLEERLGVALFFRTTRSMSLTAEGRSMLEYARRMVEAKQAAIDSLAFDAEEPVGSLRVTITTFGADTWVYQRLLDFAKRFRRVALEVYMTDTAVDLVKGGYDLGVRFGVLKDSSLKSRRVGDFKRVLVGAPEYLRQRPPISAVDDLKHCDFIAVGQLPTGIELKKGRKTESFSPHKPRIQVNSVGAARAAIIAGLGIQRLPSSAVQDALDDGSLVRVLPDWELPLLGVHAIWPEVGPRKQLTQRLIDFLVR